MIQLKKGRHQLKDHTVTIGRCSNVLQLISKLLQTLVIGGNIRKILHASG